MQTCGTKPTNNCLQIKLGGHHFRKFFMLSNLNEMKQVCSPTLSLKLSQLGDICLSTFQDVLQKLYYSCTIDSSSQWYKTDSQAGKWVSMPAEAVEGVGGGVCIKHAVWRDWGHHPREFFSFWMLWDCLLGEFWDKQSFLFSHLCLHRDHSRFSWKLLWT